MVAAWTGGLALVIGMAILGSAAPAGPGPTTVTTASAARPVVAVAVSTPSAGPPALDRATFRHLVVRGRVAVDVGEVWLMLMSEGGIPIATARLDPTGHGHAGWVPFESRLPVYRSPRTLGDALYLVTVHPSGVPIDDVRHRYSQNIFLVVGSDGHASVADGPRVSGLEKAGSDVVRDPA